MATDDIFKLFELDNTEPEDEGIDVQDIQIAEGMGIELIRKKASESAIKELSDWEIYHGHVINKPAYQRDGLTDLAAGDFFALCFRKDPILVEACEDETRLGYIRAISETTDYKTLHSLSFHNPTVSGMSADSLLKEYVKLLKELKKQEEDCKRRGIPAGKAEQEKELTTLESAAKATAEAMNDAKEMDDFAQGMGTGSDDVQKADMKKLGALFQRMKHSKALKKINEFMGNYMRCAAAEQKKKVQHGYDDVVGVQMTGNVADVLPHELGLLAHPLTKMETLRRLMENQCLGRLYQGVEAMSKGPNVIVVDTSGSMSSNDNCYKAKAIALTMARNSKKQKRWAALIDYSGEVTGGKPGWKHVVMKPGQWDQEKIMEWLENFWSGGSCQDVPIREMPERWKELNCPKGITDLTMITDAIATFTEEEINKFNEWKKEEKVKVTTIVIGYYQEGLAQVHQYSDKVYLVPDIANVNEEAVKDVLSI